MSESSSLATLIVVSLLTHHPCVGVSAKQCSRNLPNEDRLDDSAEEKTIPLDDILHNAMFVLAISFAVASCLPPSSLDLALQCDAAKPSTEVSIQGASDCSIPEMKDTCDTSVDTTACESVSDDDSCDSSVDMSECESDGDDEEVDEFVHMLSPVEINAIKSSWISRIRMSRTCKPRSLLLQYHSMPSSPVSPLKLCDSLQSIPEYADVPAMTPCDSLLSVSSNFSTFSTASSSSNVVCATPEGLTSMTSPPQSNVEWANIE